MHSFLLYYLRQKTMGCTGASDDPAEYSAWVVDGIEVRSARLALAWWKLPDIRLGRLKDATALLQLFSELGAP
jgi:hypothetical protein